MKKQKIKFIFEVLLICILLINITLISAETSYCCEKIKDGGPWCQNAPENQCDPGYRSVPTSCEATSYCRLGTCIDVETGTCIENTPQVTCKPAEGGSWKEEKASELPQCQLGCCLIGEQAAFVTQTRCKSLSSIYGLETNYRTDIQNEIQCIVSAHPDVKGACVFEREYQKTCQFSTKKECQEMELSSGYSGVEFHEGYLCSATELATNCKSSKRTTCVDGKDDVYFLDTCGNLANIYDSKKEKDTDYWTYIAGTSGVTVCGIGSSDCGNCDYLSGTTCKAEGGINVCKDLGCEDEDFKTAYGRDPQHGETWCAESEGISTIDLSKAGTNTTDSENENLPGSRYFRLVCYNGDVTVEPCADYRQEICIQSEVNTFKTAACRVNMWQDCYAQDNVKDCENSIKRDCKVLEGFSILTDENGKSLFNVTKEGGYEASCVPKYTPGFNFWEGGDAELSCSLASTMCVVEYAAGIFKAIGGERGDITPNEGCMKECLQENCGVGDQVLAAILRKVANVEEVLGECPNECYDECMPDCVYDKKLDKDMWAKDMGKMCVSLGDCGSSVNYIGDEGYYDLDDLVTMGGEDEEE
jgi:hypothetical protein